MVNHLVETASRDGSATALNITDETEWDFERETRCGGCGGVVIPLPRRLLVRHYDDGVWEILDENHLPIISGTVNDRGLKR